MFLATAVRVEATVSPVLSLDEIISRAELIVEGTVVDVRSQFSPDGKTIVTIVTLDALRVVRGVVRGSTLEFELEGGEVGDQRVTIPGIPSFAIGGRELLFLEPNGSSVSPIVGFMQGRFRVEGGEVLDYAGRPLVDIRAGRAVVSRDSLADEPAARGAAAISLGARVGRTYGFRAGSAEEGSGVAPGTEVERPVREGDSGTSSEGVAVLGPPREPPRARDGTDGENAARGAHVRKGARERLSLEEFIDYIDGYFER